MTINPVFKTTEVNVEQNSISVETNTGKTITIQPTGVQGLSAYQIALIHGFVGTEQEWLDSFAATTADNVSVDPSRINNDTITGTNVQEVLEQQETKSINGGYF